MTVACAGDCSAYAIKAGPSEEGRACGPVAARNELTQEEAENALRLAAAKGFEVELRAAVTVMRHGASRELAAELPDAAKRSSSRQAAPPLTSERVSDRAKSLIWVAVRHARSSSVRGALVCTLGSYGARVGPGLGGTRSCRGLAETERIKRAVPGVRSVRVLGKCQPLRWAGPWRNPERPSICHWAAS